MHMIIGPLLVALTSVGVVRAAPTADDFTRWVLGVRAVFPDLVPTAGGHNLNLPHLAVRAAELIRALGPTVRRPLETITVTRTAPSVVIETYVESADLTLLRDRFARTAARFGPPTGRGARVLARLRELLFDDVAFDEQLELARFLVWSQDVDDVEDQLDEFTILDLRAFNVGREYKARFRRLRLALNPGRDEAVLRRLAALRTRARRDLVTHRTRPRELGLETLVLTEMSPELALIKGFLAHDCSSRECFGYPLAPTERVFALRRPGGATRGIAAVSRVLVGRRPSWYVNTLSGPHLNEDAVRMALAGLRAIVAAGETLSLPPTKLIEENTTIEPVRAALRPYVVERPLLPLSYLDPQERYVIERFALRPYDAMHTHHSAHEVDLGALSDPNLRITRAGYSELDWIPPRLIAPGEKIDAMVDFVADLRFEMARDFWTRAGGTLDEASALIDLFTNLAGRPRADFAAAVVAKLIEHGLPPDVATERARDAAEVPRFRLGRLVAGDALTPPERAATLAQVVRVTSRHPRVLRAPAFERWLARLDAATRDELLLAVLHAREARRRDEKREWVGAALVPRLIDAYDFERRAPGLNARGIHWTTLASAAEAFVGTTGDARPEAEDAARHMIELALRTARSPAELTARFADLLATNQNSPRVMAALGHVLDHVRALGFDDADHARLGATFDAGPNLARFVEAVTAPIGSPAEFNDLGLRWQKDAGPLAEAFGHAALFARTDDFLNARPTPSEIAHFRGLAARRGDAADLALARRVLATHPTTWHDLPVLARFDADVDDAALRVAGGENLDRLADLFDAETFTGQPVRRAVARLAAEVHRHAHLRQTTDPAAWLRVMRRHPRSGLTAAQVRRFVGLGPSIAQFRECALTSGDIRGYGRAAAPLVKTFDDLLEITRPIELDGVSHFTVRREMLWLMDELARRPGAAARWTELDFDRAANAAGLDIGRYEIAPLALPATPYPCESALVSPPKP